MDAVEQLRSQFALAHRLLDQVLADVSDEQFRAKPAGTINPIASIWAHIVHTEDLLVNARTLQRPTVSASGGWSAKTGVPEPDQPSQPDDQGAWVANMDIPAFRDYAAAVFAATEEGLANADLALLEREVEMGPMGKRPALFMVSGIGLYHVGEHTGEIAAIKGVSGAKGLPF
jgi:hypothetical protein